MRKPRFHHHRIPLVLVIGGSACVGKSTLATQLAERLNFSSVLQTDVVYALMTSILARADASASPCPPSLRSHEAPSDATVADAYARECGHVMRGEWASLDERRAAPCGTDIMGLRPGRGGGAGGRARNLPRGPLQGSRPSSSRACARAKASSWKASTRTQTCWRARWQRRSAATTRRCLRPRQAWRWCPSCW